MDLNELNNSEIVLLFENTKYEFLNPKQILIPKTKI